MLHNRANNQACYSQLEQEDEFTEHKLITSRDIKKSNHTLYKKQVI